MKRMSQSKITITTFSKLMGCSYIKARKIARELEKLGEITEEMLGITIQQIRNRQVLRKYERKEKQP